MCSSRRNVLGPRWEFAEGTGEAGADLATTHSTFNHKEQPPASGPNCWARDVEKKVLAGNGLLLLVLRRNLLS